MSTSAGVLVHTYLDDVCSGENQLFDHLPSYHVTSLHRNVVQTQYSLDKHATAQSLLFLAATDGKMLALTSSRTNVTADIPFSVCEYRSIETRHNFTHHDGVVGEAVPHFLHELDEVLRVPVGHIDADVRQFRHELRDRLELLQVTLGQTDARRNMLKFQN